MAAGGGAAAGDEAGDEAGDVAGGVAEDCAQARPVPMAASRAAPDSKARIADWFICVLHQ
jgi:hypothetical protein